MSDIKTTLNACELVWRQQSVTTGQVSEMRAELESHLREALAAGKDPETVIGPDISRFAMDWAHAQPRFAVPSTAATKGAQDRADRPSASDLADRSRTRLWWTLGAISLVTLLGLVLGPRGTAAELEPWQWIFVISTFVLLVGEMLSGGFFVLPFGVGSAIAAFLAFVRVEPPVLLTVFAIVSALALWGLRELARKDDDNIVPVGANRYVGQAAVAVSPIHGLGTTGRVRIGTEDWLAIADHNEHISAGSVVRISEVRGARLVVHTE